MYESKIFLSTEQNYEIITLSLLGKNKSQGTCFTA